MERMTENEIEQVAIELLERSGYQYIYAKSIAPASAGGHHPIITLVKGNFWYS